MATKEPERGRFIPMTADGEFADFVESPEEKAFADFHNSLNAGEDMATVRVSKIPKSTLTGHPTNAKSIQCFSYPVDQHTLDSLIEFLRENYGGGLYRLIGTQKGRKGTAFNQLLEIAESIQIKKNVDGNPTGSVSAIMDSVSGMIMQSQQRTEELLLKLGVAGGPRGPVTDPAQVMAQTMGMFTQMLAAMAPIFGGQKAAPQTDFMGEIQKFASLKTLLEGFGNGGGNDSKESNFYDVVTQGFRTFAPLIAQVVPGALAGAAAQLQLNPPAPMMSAPSVVGVVATNGAPVPLDAPTLSPDDMRIKEQVDLLVANAKSGAQPDRLAETIFQMTPDADLEKLDGFIRSPHVIEHMAALNPEVRAHYPFFQALRESLIRVLDTSLEPESPSVGESLQSST